MHWKCTAKLKNLQLCNEGKCTVVYLCFLTWTGAQSFSWTPECVLWCCPWWFFQGENFYDGVPVQTHDLPPGLGSARRISEKSHAELQNHSHCNENNHHCDFMFLLLSKLNQFLKIVYTYMLKCKHLWLWWKVLWLPVGQKCIKGDVVKIFLLVLILAKNVKVKICQPFDFIPSSTDGNNCNYHSNCHSNSNTK